MDFGLYVPRVKALSEDAENYDVEGVGDEWGRGGTLNS